jgi:hypothetical protein
MMTQLMEKVQSLDQKVDELMEQNQSIRKMQETWMLRDMERMVKKKGGCEKVLEMLNQRTPPPTKTFLKWTMDALQEEDEWILEKLRTSKKMEEAMVWVLQSKYEDNCPFYATTRSLAVYDGNSFRWISLDELRSLLLMFQCRAMCAVEDWKASIDKVLERGRQWFDEEEPMDDNMRVANHFYEKQYFIDISKVNRMDVRNQRSLNSFQRMLRVALWQRNLISENQNRL